MPWKLVTVLAFALVWLPGSSAKADCNAQCRERSCCDYNGLYLGVGGGYSFEQFGGGDAGNSAIVNARIGYRFVDFLALEAQGEYLPHFNGKSGQFNSGRTVIWGAWANAKLYPLARLTGAVQPYALAGVGWMFERSSGGPGGTEEDNGVAGRFGGGIDFFMTDHLFLTVDAAYVLPSGHVSELDNVQVGGAVQYRF